MYPDGMHVNAEHPDVKAMMNAVELEERMHNRSKGIEFEVLQGDITKLEVDAIVNAAHEGLTGGGGVDGAIHRAAGPQLLGECLNLYGCPTGEARITAGYKLPAKYVIHTVGPVWQGGSNGEAELLAKAYKSCLEFAEMQGIKSIAFPCISTGAYAFPPEQAAAIAVNVAVDHAANLTYLKKIVFICFNQSDYEIYQHIFEATKGE